MTIIRSKGKLRKREKNDFYPTPPELCRAALCKSQVSTQFPMILDPGCGDGPWGKAAYTRWPNACITGVDIRDVDPGYNHFIKGDFLSRSMDWRTAYTGYDLIIGNPPYKFAEQFVRQSIDMLRPDGEVIFLLRLAFLESDRRGNGLFKELPPREVFVSTRRVSFTGNRKTDDTAYAIYIWQKGNPLNVTYLRWFSWDYDKIPTAGIKPKK